MAIKDNKDLKAFFIATLRRASYRWPARNNARKRFKLARNEYFCNMCGLIHGHKDGVMDHINPVVDPMTGWVDGDVYAERMLCDEYNYQLLCRPCHKIKTNHEKEIRKQNRKK